jgi:hypothetical protein
VILICKIESEDQMYVCRVPFCKSHAKTQSTNRKIKILTGKKIYLLGQEIMDKFNSDDVKTTASDMDEQADPLLIEEDESIQE